MLRTATTTCFTQQTRLTPGGTASLAEKQRAKGLLTKPYYVHSTKPIRLRTARTVSHPLRQTRGEGNTKRFKQDKRKNKQNKKPPRLTLRPTTSERTRKKETKHKNKRNHREELRRHHIQNKKLTNEKYGKKQSDHAANYYSKRCNRETIQKRPKNIKPTITFTFNHPTFTLPYTFHISTSPSPSHSTTPPPTQTAQNSPFTFHLSH